MFCFGVYGMLAGLLWAVSVKRRFPVFAGFAAVENLFISGDTLKTAAPIILLGMSTRMSSPLCGRLCQALVTMELVVV